MENYDLGNMETQIRTSSHGSLARVLLLWAVFLTPLIHFFRVKSILPYFSSPISVPFPEVRSRKGTESGLGKCVKKTDYNLCLRNWFYSLQLCGATTCHRHQFLPTLTVPKSDSLPALLLPHPPHEQDEQDEIWVPGVFLASCAGIDGTSEEAVDGTNPESMFQ